MSWQKHPDKAPECEMNSSTKRLCVCVHVCFKVRVCVCMCALKCVCVWVMHMCDVHESVWVREREKERKRGCEKMIFFSLWNLHFYRAHATASSIQLCEEESRKRERERVCVCVSVRERERERRGVFPGLNFLFIFSIMPKFFFLILFFHVWRHLRKKLRIIFFVLGIYFLCLFALLFLLLKLE